MKKIVLIATCFIALAACKEKAAEPTEAPKAQPVATTETTTQTNTMENQNDTTQYYVNISTSFGDMVVKLYNETPKHRDNFLKLAKEGYFNDLLFHRVIKDFMIQGGDPNSKNAAPNVQLGAGGPSYTIPAEFNRALIHKKGALSAARQGDQVNPAKASSGSQFYIVQGKVSSKAELDQIARSYNITYTPEQIETYTTIGGTPFLDMNYTVFGEVVKGLEVIDKIAAVKTAYGDRPLQDVKMTVTVVTK